MRAASIVLGLLLAARAAQAQVYPNLDFEPGRNHRQPLLLWQLPTAPGTSAVLDSTVAHSGRGSLRLDLGAAASRQPAYASCALAPDSARGQLLTVRLWVRRRNWHGRLRWFAGSSSSTVAGLSGESATVVDSVQGTADWQPLTLRLPVKATAFGLGVRLEAQGSGQLWLDDLTLAARGRVLPELPAPLTEALLLPLAAAQQPNWTLERLPPALSRPSPAVATLQLDSLQAQQGRYALRLQRVSPPSQPMPVVYLGTLPLDLRDAGKTLTIRGYWRRPGPATPAAGAAPQLAVRLLRAVAPDDSRWQPDTLGYKPAATAPGPEWSAFAVTAPLQLFLDIDRTAQQVSQAALSIGVQLPDARPLELDHLTFAIDGRPYAPTGPPLPPPPSALETAWLRTTLRPLRLATPATAAADVAALGSYLAPARLLGLGELGHGSHEVFALHGQLIRYLVGQKGYTGLLLDADPLACEALQAYLRTGQGNPAQLLADLHDNWNVPEALDLLRWLRQWQQTHPATPLLLAGLDVRQPEQALAAASRLLEADDEFAQSHLARARHLLAAFPHPAAQALDLRRHPAQETDSLLTPLRRLLTELNAGLDARAQLGGHPTSLAQASRRRYYLRLLEQGAAWRRIQAADTAATFRQACLAENAWYQSQQEAGSAARLVLWANNGVVGHAGRTAGSWLQATLGSGYRALGTVLGQGQLAAQAADGSWAPMPLAPLRPGAYELWLHTGPATSWLPLAGLELHDDNAWLFQQQLLRDVGSRAVRNQYQLHALRSEFEAVVYLDKSSATVALPASPAAGTPR